MKTNQTIDQKINALAPGRGVQIGKGTNCRVMAERSGCGKILRIVREFPNSFEVIKKTAF